jgi:hypothetical protein
MWRCADRRWTNVHMSSDWSSQTIMYSERERRHTYRAQPPVDSVRRKRQCRGRHIFRCARPTRTAESRRRRRPHQSPAHCLSTSTSCWCDSSCIAAHINHHCDNPFIAHARNYVHVFLCTYTRTYPLRVWVVCVRARVHNQSTSFV